MLDALEIERAAIVANSMGGLWAFWLALDRPARVGPIAQMGCPAVLLDSNAPLGLRLATAPVLGRLMAALEPPSRAQVRRLLTRLGDPIVALREPQLVEAMIAGQPLHAEAWMSLVSRLTGPLRRREISLGAEELRAVRRPVHFLWGTRDPFGPPALGRRASELLPDAGIDVVDAGHLPWLAQPGHAADAVRGFLAKAEQYV